MASSFLKKRFAKVFEETFGDAVEYTPISDQPTTDPDTGEVDETAAYLGLSTTLPAMVELAPSKARREALGLEQDFEATITLPSDTLAKAGVTLKIGDRFVVPSDTDPYYVEKIVPGYQSGGEFLGRTVAVSHRVGRR